MCLWMSKCSPAVRPTKTASSWGLFPTRFPRIDLFYRCLCFIDWGSLNPRIRPRVGRSESGHPSSYLCCLQVGCISTREGGVFLAPGPTRRTNIPIPPKFSKWRVLLGPYLVRARGGFWCSTMSSKGSMARRAVLCAIQEVSSAASTFLHQHRRLLGFDWPGRAPRTRERW